MAHTISDRRARQREKEMDPKAWRERQNLPHEERIHAEIVVDAFNERAKSGRAPSFFPTIGTAIAARMQLLEVLCPGCQTVGTVDLRTIDYHQDAPISALIPKLSCRRCCPNPPFARIIGLRRGAARWDDRS